MHIEPTKGNKEQAENYIQKKGKYKEDGEKVLYLGRHGIIKGEQGKRKDLSIIEELIDQGKNINEILDTSVNYRQYEKLIKDVYFRKKWKETPVKREIKVYWHVGKTGTGKSYEMVTLTEQYGEDNIYVVTDYENGFDKYSGEKVLFMDEFRGQIKYNQLLTILDCYRAQVRCRYTNIFALWNEVHITSVLSPEDVYKKMVQENRTVDTIEQLLRRINFVVEHFIKDGKYTKTKIKMEDYLKFEEIQVGIDELPF